MLGSEKIHILSAKKMLEFNLLSNQNLYLCDIRYFQWLWKRYLTTEKSVFLNFQTWTTLN